jgi:hypothetical protein
MYNYEEDDVVFESIRESIENEDILNLEQIDLIQKYMSKGEQLPSDIVEYLVESHKNILLRKRESLVDFPEWDDDEDLYH